MGKSTRTFRKKSTFWIVMCAVLLCTLLAVCITFGQADNSLTVFDFPGRYLVSQVLYDDLNDEYPYTTDNTFLYDFSEDYVFGIFATEHHEYSHSGNVERIRLSDSGFDRYFNSDTSAWLTGADAASLRKQNHFAWKMVVDDADASTVYYILQQKNKEVILFVGTSQKNGADNATVFHCGFLLNSLYGNYKNCVEQEICGDIDGDGKEEVCYLCYGPLSGLDSFRLVVKTGGQTKYNIWFTGHAEFAKDVEGNLKLKMLYNSGMEIVIDVKVVDGELQLYKDEKPFEYYEWWNKSE